MRLFIAEKPSLGRAIAQFLPAKPSTEKTHISAGTDTVTWCFGHLLEPADPEDYNAALKRWDAAQLPIIPQDWKLLPRSDAKAQIAIIKKLLHEADSIVNAGDPDREGQLLVDELLEYLGNRKPVSRIWLAALDEASVRKALGALRSNEAFFNLKCSAEARQRADWLVGMNLTRAYTLAGQKAGYQGVLSVGRVQTPTLALVVARDTEIEAFRPRDYYVLRALMSAPQGEFKARWHPADSVATDDAGRLLDPAPARAVAAKIEGKGGRVNKCDVAEKSEAAPLPYCLSRLQADANRLHSYSAQKVLDVAQELYERKLMTYPRTDCSYLPESMFAETAGVLAHLSANPALASMVQQASVTIQSSAWNDTKITAHHAIIPTGECASTDLSAPAFAIYKMIVRAYVMQFMPPHRYQQIDIEIVIEGERFSAMGRKSLVPGWKALAGDQEPERDDHANRDADEAQALPVLIAGQEIICRDSTIEAKKTTPPARFTEGTLIRAMANIHRYVTDPAIKKRLRETAGIGTEATRAGIIEVLKGRGFLVARGKELRSSDTGRSLIAVLPEAVRSPALTALFEQGLQKIAEGALQEEAFVKAQTDFVRKYVELAGSAAVKLRVTPCPVCGEGHLRRVKGSKGWFLGCSRYENGCNARYSEKAGKPDISSASAADKGGTRRTRQRRGRSER